VTGLLKYSITDLRLYSKFSYLLHNVLSGRSTLQLNEAVDFITDMCIDPSNCNSDKISKNCSTEAKGITKSKSDFVYWDSVFDYSTKTGPQQKNHCRTDLAVTNQLQ